MQGQSTLRDYVAVLRRRKWLIIGAVLAGLVASLAYSFTRTPLYEASAQLAYQKQLDVSSLISSAPVLSGVDVELQLETYANLMTTDEMANRAAEEVGLKAGDDLGVTISALPVKDTAVLKVTAVATDPETATMVANAYADSFARWREQVAINQYDSALNVVSERLAQYSTETSRQDPGYYALVNTQQNLRVLKGAATGNFTVASAATVPDAPFSPKHGRDAILGLVIGLVVGVIAAALAEQLDVRVHTVEDIARMTGLPVIGRLPRMGRDAAAKADLQVVSQPQGQLSEAFRMVRGNLEFVDVDGDLRTILITSCTQSEGKTSTVCNLAVTLARSGKNVIVVDADLRRPRVHTLFKLQNRIGVSTVVTGQSNLEDSLQRIPGAPQQGAQVGSLRILPSGPVPPNPGELVASRRLAAVIATLAERADIVLVDAAPVLVVGDAGALAGSVQGLILITRLGVVTKSMLREVNEFLASLPIRKLGAVITAVPSEASAYRYTYYREKAGAEEELETQPLETPASPIGSI